MAHAISRRGLLEGAAAVGVAIGTGVLTGCATGGGNDDDNVAGKVNAANPLGVKEDAPLEVVIFNGGFGVLSPMTSVSVEVPIHMSLGRDLGRADTCCSAWSLGGMS
jgi:hypothetical protein